MGTVNPESSVFCQDIFGLAVGGNNPINIYAKSMIASIGNYYGTHYLGEEPIFPTNFSELE